jgi:hypothetical protein
MKTLLIMSLFLTASAPALAVELDQFLKTMSMGTEVTAEPAPQDRAIAGGQTYVQPAPAQKAQRPRGDAGKLDSIWLIGVFR